MGFLRHMLLNKNQCAVILVG